MNNINYRLLSDAQIRASDKESRIVTFVASDSSRDSHHTIVNQKGWDLERFNNNGVIGYQHKVYQSTADVDNPDNVIGKGRAYLADNKLMVDVEFEPADINPLADKIYKKILFGSLKGVSVGFIETGKGHFGKGDEGIGKANETYYFEGQELLEISVCNIPSNANALKRNLEMSEADIAFLRSEAESIQEEAIEEPQVMEEPKDVASDNEKRLKNLIKITNARISLAITK